jgi:hypothetical protein
MRSQQHAGGHVPSQKSIAPPKTVVCTPHPADVRPPPVAYGPAPITATWSSPLPAVVARCGVARAGSCVLERVMMYER